LKEVLYKDDSASTQASRTLTYEGPRDLLTVMDNQHDSQSATISKYTYTYDALGRREFVVNEELQKDLGNHSTQHQLLPIIQSPPHRLNSLTQ
jgi:hypothetical protein